MKWLTANVVLMAACAVTAIAVVASAYAGRQAVSELQSLRGDRAQLQADYEKLNLERGTFATDWRIDTAARENFDMLPISEAETVILRGNGDQRGDQLGDQHEDAQ